MNTQIARNTWCAQTVSLPLRQPDFYNQMAKLALVMPVTLSQVKNHLMLIVTWNQGTRWIN
jgi:hypothetical protein